MEDYETDGPALFSQVIDNVNEETSRRGITERYAAGDSVVIAGWCKTAGRMRGISIAHHPDDADPVRVRTENDWFNVAPGDCFDQPLHLPESPEDMMPLARRQLDWMLKTDSSTASGGSLIVAEMTPHKTLIRDMGPI